MNPVTRLKLGAVAFTVLWIGMDDLVERHL